MPKRKVVFVGTDDKLYALSGFHYIFKENGWEVKDCRSIEEAQNQGHIDILVIWAYADFYVQQYQAWENHPKAIWYIFSPFDIVPVNVKSLGPMALPTQLYQEALSLCK